MIIYKRAESGLTKECPSPRLTPCSAVDGVYISLCFFMNKVKKEEYVELLELARLDDHRRQPPEARRKRQGGMNDDCTPSPRLWDEQLGVYLYSVSRQINLFLETNTNLPPTLPIINICLFPYRLIYIFVNN